MTDQTPLNTEYERPCGHPNHGGGPDHDCKPFLPCDDPACPCGPKTEKAQKCAREFVPHPDEDDEANRRIREMEVEVARLRLERAEFADQNEALRSRIERARELEADRVAVAVANIAAVTPCACSAQRARAEAAEAEVVRLREVVRAVDALAEASLREGRGGAWVHDGWFAAALGSDLHADADTRTMPGTQGGDGA